jgi:hypothetical protein
MKCLELILGCNLNDREKLLCSLAIKKGGLGLRAAHRHCKAAFESSLTMCSELDKGRPVQRNNSDGSFQKVLSDKVDDADLESILAGVDVELTRMLLTQRKKVGGWISKLPVWGSG